jgi:succinate dehydrogenase / fumarate reductase cytochrome b subunit
MVAAKVATGRALPKEAWAKQDGTRLMRNASRPLSPHLSIWRWGPHMVVSILHRATGAALAIAGGIGLAWWLAAAASGPAEYDRFMRVADSWFGKLVLVGLTWSFFQHLFSGLRHLVLDTGAGYELRTNKTWSILTMVGSATVTVLVWLYILTRG